MFSCSHYHGIVPAESTIKLKVKNRAFYLCWLSKNWVEMQAEKTTDMMHHWFLPQSDVWGRRAENESLSRTGYWHIFSMEFLRSFLRHHFEGKQRWYPEIFLRNTPSHWWFCQHFYITLFSNFSHFAGVFYSSKSLLAVCGLSGHYGSWSYKLLCHQVHWSGERWLSL